MNRLALKEQSMFFAVDTPHFTRTKKANYSHGDSITMVNLELVIKKTQLLLQEYGGEKKSKQLFKLKEVSITQWL